MPTLRKMIDGHTLEFASPAADHVARHIDDPFEETKGDLDELNQKRMEYELAKQKMHMKLAPVEQVTQGIRDMHDMNPDLENAMPDSMQGPGMPPQPGMSAPIGHPMMPGQPPMAAPRPGMQPGQPQPGQQPGFPPKPAAGFPPKQPQPGQPQPGMPPQNMTQSPGAMNVNRPSQSGFAPGTAPGFSEKQVVPQKMGVPQPGQAQVGKKAGIPSWQPAKATTPPKVAPQQYNPSAAPPQGSGQLPGAQGPGDPNVQGPIKKAQKKSNKATSGGEKGAGGGGRKIKISVHADRSMPPAKSPLESYAGSDTLRSCGDYKKMEGYGTPEGVSKAWDTRGRGRKEGEGPVPTGGKVEIKKEIIPHTSSYPPGMGPSGGEKPPSNLTPSGHRPLEQIASEIQRDWGSKVNYAAKPYLEAMHSLHDIKDNYYQDSGHSVVAYFLSNATSWRGEKAKAIKAELKQMLKR